MLDNHFQLANFIVAVKIYFGDFREFCLAWKSFLAVRAKKAFFGFESRKSWFAERLYARRGRLARPFSHAGMATLVTLGIVLAPVLAQNFSGRSGEEWARGGPVSLLGGPAVLSAFDIADLDTSTIISEKPRAEIIDYQVQPGDTISQIASKFSISIDTVRWANNLSSVDAIKPGQTIKILPITGVAHKVKRGETIYSIAKHYSTEAQGMVDFPFNEFSNDETFELAVGQTLLVPGGVMPKASGAYVARKTPDAGSVSATGRFIWPASGTLSQLYSWYHRAIDISNKSAPPILAADAGRVVMAGWPDNIGYGNRVLVDHGNGFSTLYAHLAKIYVGAGQTVNRGDQIGQMGTTGRSTGVHLHFEIRLNGAAQNPLGYLK